MLSSSDSSLFDLRLETFSFFLGLLLGGDDDAEEKLLLFLFCDFFVFNEGSFVEFDFLCAFLESLSFSGAGAGSSDVIFRDDLDGFSLSCLGVMSSMFSV